MTTQQQMDQQELRDSLVNTNQGHILEAFPNLTGDHPIAKQLASIDIKSLIETYKQQQTKGAAETATTSSAAAAAALSCFVCSDIIQPVESVLLEDPSLNK